jgi:hypothetical protein
MIEIELPWWNQRDCRFDGPIQAWIVPDLAPHLNGTFAVHRFPPSDPWSNTYSITNVETGCQIGNFIGSKKSVVANARIYCAGKTDAEFQSAIRKVRRIQRGQ